MSVEKDDLEVEEKVDVESPPTPSPPFLPPPGAIIKTEGGDAPTVPPAPLVVAGGGLVTSVSSAAAPTVPSTYSSPGGDVGVAHPVPSLLPPIAPAGLNPHLYQHYQLCYSSPLGVMNPYIMGRSGGHIPHHPPAATLRDVYSFPPYIGGRPSLHQGATPPRPSPIHPYTYTLPQVHANL